jgi:hypothetical protein
MNGSSDNRSVTARDVTDSNIVTGDHNEVSTTTRQVALPPADTVDVKAELAALRDLIVELKNVPDRGKLDRALEDAVEEAAKPNRDKAELGSAVERVIRYAKSANDFSDQFEKLQPRLTAIASWLGVAGRGLLALAGIRV